MVKVKEKRRTSATLEGLEVNGHAFHCNTWTICLAVTGMCTERI